MGKASGSLLSDILKVAFIFLLAVILLSGVSFLALRVIVRGNEVKVPNVIGRSFVSASKILSESGLDTVKIAGEKYSAQLPEGHVLEQDPIPNKKVKPGRIIKVFLSRGTEQDRVPRLIARPVSEVETILTSRGLEIGSVVKVHSDDYPQEGLIIAHTPPPDVIAQRGVKVNLLVSLGPHSVTFNMPDLKGMERQKALEALTKTGLKLGRITREPSDQESNVVLRQFPTPNDRVKRGATVDIVVSSGEVSEGTLRTALLSSYIVPKRPKTSEEPENPEEQPEEDLSPRSVTLNMTHDGITQPSVISKSGVPGTRISHVWRRVKGVAILKIFVDDIFTETMICKPPSTEFVSQ